MAACSPTAIPVPLSSPAAATVDGHDITMAAYQARLRVSQARDPFAGMPAAVPSPASPSRLEDFTIEQLIREAIISQQAAAHGITISDQQISTRITALEQSAGAATFEATRVRNGFSSASFRDYERALLAEVALLQALAKQRITQAAADLKSGQSFDAVAAKWNDDTGTAARHGEVGWVRPADVPERPLADAVESLPTGETSGVIQTDRGFVIAKVLERRNDQIRLAVILVLAPGVDLLSAQATPGWFTTMIDDRESALRNDGKITIRVGSHA
jgi:parvulin-like peptidyl-prolyl isomerase